MENDRTEKISLPIRQKILICNIYAGKTLNSILNL